MSCAQRDEVAPLHLQTDASPRPLNGHCRSQTSPFPCREYFTILIDVLPRHCLLEYYRHLAIFMWQDECLLCWKDSDRGGGKSKDRLRARELQLCASSASLSDWGLTEILTRTRNFSDASRLQCYTTDVTVVTPKRVRAHNFRCTSVTKSGAPSTELHQLPGSKSLTGPLWITSFSFSLLTSVIYHDSTDACLRYASWKQHIGQA